MVAGFIYGKAYAGGDSVVLNVEQICTVVEQTSSALRRYIQVNTLDGKYLDVDMDMSEFKRRLAEVLS